MAATPKEYTKNLKNKIITKDMLKTCLFSVNKRAKNYRDKEREYRQNNRSIHSYNRYYYDKYDNVGQMQAKKEEFYKQKEKMLSILKPICIHKEFLGYEKKRIYDYEDLYNLRKKYKKQGKIIWENYYYDYNQDREVWFFDIYTNEKKFNYYLFYELDDKSFHKPIEEKDCNKYNLKIKEIDHIQTEGYDIAELISCQFCNKLLQLIESKDYTYIEN